jgi:hypothetical protein
VQRPQKVGFCPEFTNYAVHWQLSSVLLALLAVDVSLESSGLARCSHLTLTSRGNVFTYSRKAMAYSQICSVKIHSFHVSQRFEG